MPEGCKSGQYKRILEMCKIIFDRMYVGPPLWSSGQSSWLQIHRSPVRFPALPDFLRSSGSGTGSTQPVRIIEELLE
jgi:hypothetical protein